MAYPLVILGGGLSGLAAGIRFARFGQDVLILERHNIAGGLNSYYRRQGHLIETGLHAMTNYAAVSEKRAPLNRLFRQLKLKRKNFSTLPQVCSEIVFPNQSLTFSNHFADLQEEICEKFPAEKDGFLALVAEIKSYDAFSTTTARISAKERISSFIRDEMLTDMLLCPLMLYGNSEEYDMDYGQFVVMFRSVFLEGFFRPQGTIKDFLEMLVGHFRSLGGEIRYNSEVETLKVNKQDKVSEVCLASGEVIACDSVVSTIGSAETLQLLPGCLPFALPEVTGRMSFVESIYFLEKDVQLSERAKQTIIFYNNEEKYSYRRPKQAVNPKTGVICFPDHFIGKDKEDTLQVRVTHPANYHCWAEADRKSAGQKGRTQRYRDLKIEWQERSQIEISKIIGNFTGKIVYTDTFTPLTIEKFTKKVQGAIYGSPVKIKNGRTRYTNLFIAGTDQGFLGIVGSMLSGITIVNQCILLDS